MKTTSSTDSELIRRSTNPKFKASVYIYEGEVVELLSFELPRLPWIVWTEDNGDNSVGCSFRTYDEAAREMTVIRRKAALYRGKRLRSNQRYHRMPNGNEIFIPTLLAVHISLDVRTMEANE